MNATPDDFLKTIQPSAKAIEVKFGIPWTFTAAQAAHESRYGNSKLAALANNFFGVTADETLRHHIPDSTPLEEAKAWLALHPEVPAIFMETGEQSPHPPEKIRYWSRPGDIVSKTLRKDGGSDVMVDRPFMKYPQPVDALAAWASLILRKYPEAYEAASEQDFPKFAQALQAGGYATDSSYAAQLIKVHDSLEKIA